MAKAKNNNPAKRRGKMAQTTATPESPQELAEKAAAAFAESLRKSGLTEQFKRAVESLKKLKPASSPTVAELAERAEARNTIGRYIAIRDGQIPPPWAGKNKPDETTGNKNGPQMARLLPVLRDLYPPDGLPPTELKPKAVHTAVAEIYKRHGWGEVSRRSLARAVKRSKK
jgi:hypothetical protein